MSEYRNWEKAIEDDEIEESFAHAAWIHRSAMNYENLHRATEIAFELAWRDVQIAMLEKKAAEVL
jgi:hypothetical protein